jgi:hypothetical protein
LKIEYIVDINYERTKDLKNINKKVRPPPPFIKRIHILEINIKIIIKIKI